MKNTTSNARQTRQFLPRLAFVARVWLHAAVMLVLAIFPIATPSLGLRPVTESEAPVDQDENSHEQDISLQTKTRIGRRQTGVPLQVPASVSLRVSHAAARPPVAGHRLHNNLLAPLRC
ncbi:MAG: hypothetical protein KDB05_20500 [Planctomycetales bacterium]|nr:hypothetical protein [Planctomycetales bacterium]